MKSVFINNLVSDMKLQGFYLCIEKRIRRKRDGSPYVDLLLQDKSGIIRGRIWIRRRIRIRLIRLIILGHPIRSQAPFVSQES